MKTISIELSRKGCRDALKELKKYQKEFEPKLDEICRRLAEIAADEARRRFPGGDHGNTEFFVYPPIKIENGYKIVAAGEDVYFIEFGTGQFTFPHGNVESIPVYPGSYSEQNAQQFSTYGFWWYAGERLEGTKAYMPMLYAGQAIRNNARRITQEVLNEK